jgi:hypothetical protein
MKNPHVLAALTVVNLLLLALVLTQQAGLALADNDTAVLRGRALEIVDDQGRVRASINVRPAGRSANGDAYAETVILRLSTEQGRPSVKLAASEPASGLSLAGPTGTKSTYLIIEAKGEVSSLKLRNEDGAERTLTP